VSLRNRKSLIRHALKALALRRKLRSAARAIGPTRPRVHEYRSELKQFFRNSAITASKHAKHKLDMHARAAQAYISRYVWPLVRDSKREAVGSALLSGIQLVRLL
jgi:hypothetical protein